MDDMLLSEKEIRELLNSLAMDRDETKEDMDRDEAKEDMDRDKTKEDMDRDETKEDMDRDEAKEDMDRDETKEDMDRDEAKEDMDRDKTKEDMDRDEAKEEADNITIEESDTILASEFNLYREIKPLIEEYKEYANKEMPEVFKWNDSRTSSVSKVQDRNYATDREGEILEILDEERTTNSRRLLIEELLEIRKTKMTEMRRTIFEKAGALISDSKEKVNQAIEEKRQELEEKKEAKRKNLEEKEKELEEKRQLRRDINKKSKALTKYLQLMEQDLGKNDKVYMAVGEEKLQTRREKENLSRDINALEKECTTLKFEYENFIIENDEELKKLVNRLNEFSNINFENEDAIDYILEIIQNNEELREEQDDRGFYRLGDEDVEVIEPSKILTMDDMQETEGTRTEGTRTEGTRTEGTRTEGTRTEGTRTEGTRTEGTRTEGTRTEGTRTEGTRTEGTRTEGTRTEGTKQKGAVKNGRVVNENGEPIDDIETIRAMQERQILEEELEQRLEELKAGNEDLVNDAYLLLEQNLRNRDDIESVLESLEGKNMKDIYEGMYEQAKTLKEKVELESIINQLNEREEQLIEEQKRVLESIEQVIIDRERGNEDLLHIAYCEFKQDTIGWATENKEYAKDLLAYLKENTLLDIYKDILEELKEGSDEDLLRAQYIKDIKDIMAQLEIREQHRLKSTTIVVEPKTGLIKIAIKGREKGIKFDNLLELIEQGKELQEGELISRFGVNRCDPAILAALSQIGKKFPGHKNLLDEYINRFSNGTDEIDDIVYDFYNETENKPENYKQILKACKKYSKLGEKYGMATIEKPVKEGIWSKLKDYISDRKQRRIESKEAKEYRTNRFRKSNDKNEKIEKPEKKKSPRETFIKKIALKGKKQNEGIDMSEAIKKLQSINQEIGNETGAEEEEQVL